MSFSYTYTLGVDFTATDIDVSAFQTTVAATSGLSSIQYITRSGTSVTLFFSSSIVGINLTTLNGLVSSYVFSGSSNIPFVDISSFQTLSNKEFTTSNFIVDLADSTKKLGFALVGMTTATQLTLASSLTASRTYTIPDGGAASSFLLTNSTGTQTIASGNLAFSGASSVLTIANTAASTGSSTGALRVAGGAYFGTAVVHNGLSVFNSAGSTNLATATIYVNPTTTALTGASAYYFTYLAAPITTASSFSSTASTLFIAGGPTVTTGGSSFALNIGSGTSQFNGNINQIGASSVLTIANTTTSTSSSTGGLQVAGGAYFGNFYTRSGTISSPGAASTLFIDCQGSTTDIGELVFENSGGTGDFAIYGDGGDLYWQGGGGRALQMAAFHGIILLGGRNTGVQPTYVAGLNSTFNVSIQNTADSIGLIVQGDSGQTADLQQWQNSSGTVLSEVLADGSIVITESAASTSSTTGGLRVTGGAYFGAASLFDAAVTASSTLNKITIPTFRVVSSTTTSTTSTTLVAIAGITLTPTVAGTYLIHFEAQIFANAASRTGTFAIAFNGTAITNSTVSIFLPTANTGFLQVSVTAFQTCNGTSDVLTAQHRTSASTLSESYKVFYAQRIST